MPDISRQTDVYKIGTVCQVKTLVQESKHFSPYVLKIYPIQRAEITEWLDPVVTPLCHVRVNPLPDTYLEEIDLPTDAQVLYKFLNRQFYQLTADSGDTFSVYLQFLQRQFTTHEVNSFVYMLLTLISLPQSVNTFRFLV